MKLLCPDCATPLPATAAGQQAACSNCPATVFVLADPGGNQRPFWKNGPERIQAWPAGPLRTGPDVRPGASPNILNIIIVREPAGGFTAWTAVLPNRQLDLLFVKAWQKPLPAQDNGGGVRIRGGVLFYAAKVNDMDHLWALDIRTGRTILETILPAPLFRTADGPAIFGGDPAFPQEPVLCLTEDGLLLSVGPDGTIQKTLDTGTSPAGWQVDMSPELPGPVATVYGHGSGFTLYDMHSAELVYHLTPELDLEPNPSPPLLIKNSLYYIDRDEIICVELIPGQDGKVKAQPRYHKKLDNSLVDAPKLRRIGRRPAVVGERAVCIFPEERLVKIDQAITEAIWAAGRAVIYHIAGLAVFTGTLKAQWLKEFQTGELISVIHPNKFVICVIRKDGQMYLDCTLARGGRRLWRAVLDGPPVSMRYTGGLILVSTGSNDYLLRPDTGALLNQSVAKTTGS